MMSLPERISVANKSTIIKTKRALERWSKALDVFYIKDFGKLLGPLDEIGVDFGEAQKAWEKEDWLALTKLQIELLQNWPDELSAHKTDIPRCTVYFMNLMDRKRYSLDRRGTFGDCDRHITSLNVYELIASCAYRQMNQHDLWKYSDLVEQLMALHQPWFKWQTDIQRLIIWTRRKEYENIMAYRTLLVWKAERFKCEKCRARFTRLIASMRQKFQIVSAYGKPFNEKNYYDKLEKQPDYEEIMYLRKVRGQIHGN